MTSFAAEFIRARPAIAADSEDFLRWRNDADAIAHSLSGRAVDVHEHTGWFSDVVGSSEHVIVVGEADGVDGVSKVGMCRFSRQHTGDYLVSITIDAQFRGKGVGRQLLALAIELLSHENPGPVNLLAQVKKSNEASQKLFVAADFDCVADDGDVLVFSRKVKE